MDLVTDPAVRKLMHTIVSNVLTHPDELSKYGRINLAGKTGAKLTAQPGSVEALTALGFAASEDGHLVLALRARAHLALTQNTAAPLHAPPVHGRGVRFLSG